MELIKSKAMAPYLFVVTDVLEKPATSVCTACAIE